MSTQRLTPRERARAATLAEMKSVALRQLAEAGPQALSLRAIAREIGIVPSGIYRYWAGRDELLTELIVDSYTDLAGALAQAARSGTHPRERWRATCAALRRFARREPHRFLLIYGTPVTTYRAPQDTVEPAAQVVRALTAPLRDARPAPRPGREPEPGLADQLQRLREALGGGLPEPVLAPAVGAVAQLLGLLVLELGGHFVGTFEPADALYADAVERMADRLGLD